MTIVTLIVLALAATALVVLWGLRKNRSEEPSGPRLSASRLLPAHHSTSAPDGSDAPPLLEAKPAQALLGTEDAPPSSQLRHSSTPPLPLRRPRSSLPTRPSSEPPSGLPNKAPLSKEAGRYSISSRSPQPESPSQQSIAIASIPKAPRVPGEPLEPTPTRIPPSDPPRTQRGLGIPSPPPAARRVLSAPQEDFRTKTHAGVGPPPDFRPFHQHEAGPQGAAETRPRIPLGGKTLRMGSPPPETFASAAPADTPTEAAHPETPRAEAQHRHEEPYEVPSAPSSLRGGVARPVSVEPIRGAALPTRRFGDELRALSEEFAARTRIGPRVILLTAPPHPDKPGWLAEVALELAFQLGQQYPKQVALVEADFERPRLREVLRLEVPLGKGLSEQLHASVRQDACGAWTALDPGLKFHLVLEGRIRSPGLLWSREFANVIGSLQSRYRMVLVVAPDVLTEVDRHALDDVCDDVVVFLEDSPKRNLQFLQTGTLAAKVMRNVRLSVPPGHGHG